MTPNELSELDAVMADILGYTFTKEPDDATTTPVRQWYKHTAHKQTDWRVIVSTPYLHRGLPKERPYQHSWKNFNPTTDTAAAMEVLKKCAEKTNPKISKSIDGCVMWVIRSSDFGIAVVVEATTLELAICLFAKKLFTKD